jgi:CBS domain-containing protein
MTITAADLMTSPAVTVLPEADLSQVASLLVSKHISAVPVCYPDGSLAGIISGADVIRPFRDSARRKRERLLGLFVQTEELPDDLLDFLRQDNRSAADFMERHVITAGKEATLGELAELMTAHGIKRVPIVDGKMVIGIVSRSDVLAALTKSPANMM